MKRRAKAAEPTVRVQASAKEVRDYWRSIVISTALAECANAGLLPTNERDITKLKPEICELVLQKGRALLDWACEEETFRGRSYGIESRITRELLDLINGFRPVPAGLRAGPTQLEFDTRSQS